MIDDWYLDNVVAAARGGQAALARRNRAWRTIGALARSVPGTGAAVDLALRQGFVLTLTQARGCGLSRADLRRLVGNGIWTAPRRGIVCVLPALAGDDLGATVIHAGRVEVQATAARLAYPVSGVSHDSAAAMLGIALLRPPRRPVLTALAGNGGGRDDLLVHLARLAPDELQTWFGVPVTTPARTVVDLARNAGTRAGLVAADSALHHGLVTVAELRTVLGRQARWPGIRTARRVVELADPRAESVLESLVRLLIVDGALPVPALQQWVDTHRGRYRVDGLWPERRVVLEADGMGKYARPGDLVAEKRRQEAIERAGYRVVRVTWADYWDAPHDVLARIREALRVGGPGCWHRRSSGAD